ncbi:MAG: prepilin-type N-terminal cleavage/methylation domain-containing protein [Candidatus Omnitrophota bacterium]|nr:prepilin-type N-terminal cleavage/methylation domain-containing protein [Candidatus Omnitrophota bacterium]
MKKGLTLIELMITIGMFVVLTAVTVYILIAVLRSWSIQETRSGIDISLDSGMEEMVRDLREARDLGEGSLYNNKDEIRFTQDQTAYYVYYLYNASDSYGLPFDQSLLYQIKKAALTGGMDGTFTYGSGDIEVTDVLPPTTSDLSFSSNLVTIDVSVKRRDETIRSRTQVRPRNL